MVKTDNEIIGILSRSVIFIEESKLPFSPKLSKRLKVQVPNDCGVTAKEYMNVITRPLEG
ncbi:MAG: hypothetical protein Q7U60_04700 [Candidatus Methanoperedens sp.]|jgi:hypothetical protein|nr:hypothetical protein [Candidatus Methanoperedens sp.]